MKNENHRVDEHKACGIAPLAAILRLAKEYPVFPCRRVAEVIDGKVYKEKSPLTRRGFLDASQEEAQIVSWWQKRPDALVGVPTGSRTGLTVIDVDQRKFDEAGREWFEQNTNLLLTTRVHGTLHDGFHYVFATAVTPGYASTQNATLSGCKRGGIDIRGEGGYVVWWALHGGSRAGVLAPLPAGLIDEYRIKDQKAPPLGDSTPDKWLADRELVREALRHVDPDCDRQTWITILAAVHLASGGSRDGFDLIHEWSSGELTGTNPLRYAGMRDCAYAYTSFKHDGHRKATLGTIFHLARQNGWKDGEVFDFADGEPEPEQSANEQPNDEPKKAPDGIELTPVDAQLLVGIPPRQWLYGFHYMRKMASSTASTAGVGKSSVQMVEAVSMALGFDLFSFTRDALPCGPLRVWVHNGEDPLEEIRRRVAAVLKHYEIRPEQLGGRLMITSGREHRIIIAKDISGTTVAIPKTREEVDKAIRGNRVDVLILDPFVSTHQVNENSNQAVELVMFEWRRIAEETNCAVDFTHHFRKGNGGEPSADDIRGASALLGAVRSARILAPMTKEEAEAARIEPTDRRRYVFEMNAKANLRPAVDDRKWYHLASVSLENASAPYEADQVGVATAWVMPDLFSTVTPPMQRLALNALRQADWSERRKYASSTGWAGLVVATALEIDLAAEDGKASRKEIGKLLKLWEAKGKIRTAGVFDPRQARQTPVWEVVDE